MGRTGKDGTQHGQTAEEQHAQKWVNVLKKLYHIMMNTTKIQILY
jgi:hypothetical protein